MEEKKISIPISIQILAVNTLMSRFHVGFEIELPLGIQSELYITGILEGTSGSKERNNEKCKNIIIINHFDCLCH